VYLSILLFEQTRFNICSFKIHLAVSFLSVFLKAKKRVAKEQATNKQLRTLSTSGFFSQKATDLADAHSAAAGCLP